MHRTLFALFLKQSEAKQSAVDFTLEQGGVLTNPPDGCLSTDDGKGGEFAEFNWFSYWPGETVPPTKHDEIIFSRVALDSMEGGARLKYAMPATMMVPARPPLTERRTIPSRFLPRPPAATAPTPSSCSCAGLGVGWVGLAAQL